MERRKYEIEIADEWNPASVIMQLLEAHGIEYRAYFDGVLFVEARLGDVYLHCRCCADFVDITFGWVRDEAFELIRHALKLFQKPSDAEDDGQHKELQGLHLQHLPEPHDDKRTG